ncbi:hypothetical protein M885DRAFT_512456 [Pelagophyceae sp. CCMP2097]|nr:hypothetical protein M885DRAFT_512456 [Pelagophyceae sp. CCMP2097]
MAGGAQPLLVPVAAKGAPKSCAIHKLRWGSNVPADAEEATSHNKLLRRGAESSTALQDESRAEAEAEDAVDSDDDTDATTLPGPIRPLRPTKSLESLLQVAALVDAAEEPGSEPSPPQERKSPVAELCRRDDAVAQSVALGAALPSSALGAALPGGAALAAYVGPGGRLRKSESETSDATGWGFYEDCEPRGGDSSYRLDTAHSVDRETPEYVLEDSLASQALWHTTAGLRPAQPAAERRRFEEAYERNFAQSQIGPEDGGRREGRNANKWCGLEAYLASTALMHNNDASGGIIDAHVQRTTTLLREQSPFGTSVTKSWQCECCGELTSIMIRIPKYQIVRVGPRDVHAEYLVVCRLGAVTFGLWRRSSHFQELAEAIASKEAHVDYQNTLWSWRCLKRRQRWFRCLDKDYLALKCFLLERFLHDAVFESDSSTLFTDFLEIKL